MAVIGRCVFIMALFVSPLWAQDSVAPSAEEEVVPHIVEDGDESKPPRAEDETDPHIEDSGEADETEEAMPQIVEDDEDEAIPQIVDDEDEAIPHIVDDEDEAVSTSDAEAIPYIVDEEPSIDESDSAAANSSVSMEEWKAGIIEFLTINWQWVAGIAAAIVLLPLLLRRLFRRKDPVAKYAAASMSLDAGLPKTRPVDPLAIDSKEAFSDDGFVSPISELPNDDDSFSMDMYEDEEVVPGYAGSVVPPGAPDYPSVGFGESDDPVTVVRDGDNFLEDQESNYGDDALQFVDSEDSTGVEWSEDEPLIEFESAPPAEIAGAFEVSEDSLIDAEEDEDDEFADMEIDEVAADAGPSDYDIKEFEAANAEDPFEDTDEVNDVPAEEADSDVATPIEKLVASASGKTDEDQTVDVAAQEFPDNSEVAESLPEEEPATAAIAAGAAAVAESADASELAVAEIRISAIQSALAQEKRRVAKLDHERKRLKKMVARLQSKLVASEKKVRSSEADVMFGVTKNSRRDAAEVDALIKLTEENRALLTQLHEEQAQRQAGTLEKRGLEASVKSLDARLDLVNTERDNLARMLYDAKRSMANNADPSRKPR